MKLKLTKNQLETVAFYMLAVIDELSPSRHRYQQLLCTVLAEIAENMHIKMIRVKPTYSITLKPYHAVAIQALCEDYMMPYGDTHQRMVAGKIMTTTHPQLA